MTPRRSASGARSAGEPGSGSLDLIHRTKVPKLVPMRVRSVFAKVLGQGFNVAVKGGWYGLPDGPVRDVVLRRLVNGYLASRKALMWELYEDR